MHSAINQQIATKTIMKLGFKVTAAWNGKDALEYMAAAKDGKHPKPDIILMDVQMPVIDGYKCTHLLRHHVPYKAYVRDIPIVAMTASAIQGDKEKCTKAGMDDYLSKPVKSKTLERINADIPGVEHDHGGGSTDTLNAIKKESENKNRDPEKEDRGDVATPRPLTRNNSYEPSPFDSPGVNSKPIRRSETDELALQAQAGKLMDAAGGKKLERRGASFQTVIAGDTGDSLTEENVEKLEKEEKKRRS
ncbi:hypothetical protein COL154_009665 [Colletotrichum chrysophilum]|nr:hypothetical protein COL154_009665 [Colletotrichum chrysophilum]